MVSSKPPIPVYSLRCTACDAEKYNITMEFCSTCEQAMLRHFPVDYFKTAKNKKNEKDFEKLTAVKVLEVLELASINAPIQLAA